MRNDTNNGEEIFKETGKRDSAAILYTIFRVAGIVAGILILLELSGATDFIQFVEMPK